MDEEIKDLKRRNSIGFLVFALCRRAPLYVSQRRTSRPVFRFNHSRPLPELTSRGLRLTSKIRRKEGRREEEAPVACSKSKKRVQHADN